MDKQIWTNIHSTTSSNKYTPTDKSYSLVNQVKHENSTLLKEHFMKILFLANKLIHMKMQPRILNVLMQ